MSSQLNATLLNYPMATIPERKITQNTSPIGIDRAILFDDKSYNNRQIDLTIGFDGKQADANIAKFLSHLDTGKYENFQMYSDPDYIYQVTRSGSSTKSRPEYSASYRELTVSLNAAPFKYLVNNNNVTVSAGDAVTVVNPTQYSAKPLIKISVKGDTDLTINGHKLTIKSVQDVIYLDSVLQDAYVESGYTVTNANNQVSLGAYPELKSGTNTIQLSKGTATIETRWRTI